MALKMNLIFIFIFINQRKMAFVLNYFEGECPGNSHLAREKVAKYITIKYNCIRHSVHIILTVG